MKKIALITAGASLADDHDMPLLTTACEALGLVVDVCCWDDPVVDWSQYEAAILRSPWDYSERLPEFLAWCERASAATIVVNPLSVVRWCLDKHYLLDLERLGVPVVPSRFVEPGSIPCQSLRSFLREQSVVGDFVVKPSVGCYSKDVRRYKPTQELEARAEITRLLNSGVSVILQPYLSSIDVLGETNLVYFNGVYSHAIRKEALLMEDGTVNVPTYDFRSPREATQTERDVAEAALGAAERHLRLDSPLLYARVDLIRDGNGTPRLLELDIAEPSLNLAFSKTGTKRFAEVLSKLERKKG